WPEIAREVAASCQGARSVIAFTEGRLMSEKLAYYVNELEGDGFARTHHGSISKEQRFEAESDLRAGKLRLLCATSSMELGIDVGEIDRVIQVACPSSIASVMQRLGRAGHNPGRVSTMHMFPRTVSENLYCALTANAARAGGIEKSRPPRQCLDVLAQHLVSMATAAGYTVDDVMTLLPSAYPFREVSHDDVRGILRMLAGDYEHKRDIPVRPRLIYDRINERIEGDAYSRMLATSGPGTIPDTGMYAAKTQSGVKIGDLDEEFVGEMRVGYKFLLGSFAWRISSITKDTVSVAPASPEGAIPPFWRHSQLSRRLQTGLFFGEQLRKLTQASYSGNLIPELQALGLDEHAAEDTADFIERQLEVTQVLPNDLELIAEHSHNETGLHQIMIHSIYGRQVNAPLSLLLTLTAKSLTGTDVDSFDDDDGILLMSRGENAIPEELLQAIRPETAQEILEAALPGTPLFNISFRHNAGRALMMGVRNKKRTPLWVQRFRASEMLDNAIHHKEHPLMRETKRECLEDYWDLPGLIDLLVNIQSGVVKVRELFVDEPSPMSLPLRRKSEADLVYNYTPTTENVLAIASQTAKAALKDIGHKLKPNPDQLVLVSERQKLPEDINGLHSLLMIEGDIIAGEIPMPLEWFETLAAQGRCLYIEPGLWIAAEHKETYQAALEDNDAEARQNIVRRALRYRGAMDTAQLAERYFWQEETAQQLLDALIEQGTAIMESGLYYHAELYERARRATITQRRQVRTVPGFHYAALVAGQLKNLAPPQEQLRQALEKLSGRSFPVGQWEAALLPARVTTYRPELLDKLLASGEVFWRLSNESITFHPHTDIDWDADLDQYLSSADLDQDEQLIIQLLQKRGATFLYTLPHDMVKIKKPLQSVLFPLMEKGLIYADSFIPIRMWMNKDKTSKSSIRQRVAARVTATDSGRWDIVRPLKPLSIDERISRAFDKTSILCRETIAPLPDTPWSAALEALRVWEYTGRARRGYFVEGLSGAQYIRDDAYTQITQALEHPTDKVIWLPAPDPNQAWGKTLPYSTDKSFISAQGTVVALKKGIPIAVFERKGHTLRVFDETVLETVLAEALAAFTEAVNKRNIYPSSSIITVKDYPQHATQALIDAGFVRVMMDYVYYRTRA
ncbi:MAG: DEAD/DEAH box helicase, partial [Defluviitaleaceae bacterium]|nr:DEAD/DEAH box helicase [Defluviitaleaceae bacterium]